MAEQFDLVIIGGGPGGYGAGLYAGASGMSVALIEKDKVGGTCLHRGCIPAKEFLETASIYRHVSTAKEFGINASQPTVDFSVSQARKQKVVDQLWRGTQGLLKARKVQTYIGTGQLFSNRLVKFSDGTELVGDNVILATGSVPRTIPGFEVDGKFVMTSDEVLSLDSLPGSIAVIGGGAIGCEFASMFSDLGVQVTLLEALDKILPGCDRDVADLVVKSFEKRGMTVRAGVKVTGHTPNGNTTTVHFGDDESVTVDAIVVSVGRKPLSDSLGLVGTGVKIDERGFITVNEYMQTHEPYVYAIGDVVNTPALAHVGFAEAILAVKHMLGEDPTPVDYTNVPWCIYCHPEVAFAGLSEEGAREAGYDVAVSKHKFIGNSRALIVGETEGLVKIIAEKRSDGTAGRILGVHMVGPWVTEQLSGGYLAVNWEATVDDVAQFVQPHPTMTELFGESVMALTGRGLHG